ncbi:trypsin-like peptidase domain-containing protein [Calditrichota bacterium]
MILIRWIIFIFILIISVNAQHSFQQQILDAKNKVIPALVHIQPVKEVFASGKKVKVKVTGSGVIFSPEGYVLTNNHVAEKARYVMCTLANKDEVPAYVVGLDALTDLAVLKLDLSEKNYKKVKYVDFGDSDSLQVGQFVMALGSPLGLSRSVSVGVISSLDRYFEDRGEMVSPFNLWIQTDAAINPGNSGGPLVDMDGKVIGINARAITFGENLGFAIPINTAKLIIGRLLKEKEVKRSYIGVEWQEIKDYRNYKNNKSIEGALVANVDKKSPAEKAGLLPGDVVLAMDDLKFSATFKEELPLIRKKISEFPVGSNITVKILRDDKQMKLTLKTEQRGKFEGNEFECKEWGLSVQEITPRVAKNLKLKDTSGVLISGIRLGSLADDANIYRGEILKLIDDKNVQGIEQFKKMYNSLKNLPKKGRMLQLIFRNSTKYALLREK